MSTITKKDLSIFRGTYLECKAQPTEDMKIYLAWDTHEIYVGNAYGEKTLYGVSKSLFERINLKFVELESFMDSKVSEYVDEKFDELLDLKLADLKKDLELVISEKVKFHVDLKTLAIQNEVNDNKFRIESLKSSASKHEQTFELNKKIVDDELKLLRKNTDNNDKNINSLRNTINDINSGINKSIQNLTDNFNNSFINLDESLRTFFTNKIDKEIALLTGVDSENYASVTKILEETKDEILEDIESKINISDRNLQKLIDEKTDEKDFNSFKNTTESSIGEIDGKITKLNSDLSTEIGTRTSKIKDLNDKIDSAESTLRSEINSKITSLTEKMDQLIGTNVEGEGLFSTINKLEAKHDLAVADLQGQINDKISSSTFSNLSNTVTQLNADITENSLNITALSGALDRINYSIGDFETKTEVDKLRTSIGQNSKNIENANKNISANSDEINNLDERITSLENSGIDTTITERISALESANKDINSSISGINDKISEIDTIKTNIQSNTTNLSSLENRVGVLEADTGNEDEGNCLIYISGNTLSEDVRDNNFKLLKGYITDNRQMLVIFCMSDSPSSFSAQYRYKRGTLYFFDGITITAISGGSGTGDIEKDKFTAEVYDFVVSNWPTKSSYEISDTIYDNISISAKLKGDISDPNAVGSVSLTFDGSSKTVSINEIKDENDNLLYKGISSGTFSIDGSKAKEYKLSFSVTAAAEDTENYRIFEVKNGSHSKSVSFYKPSFIYLNDEEIYRGNGLPASKTYTTINAGDVLSFIVPSSKTYSKYWLTKTDYGYNNFTETTEETKTINNVNDVEYNVYKIRFAAGASNLLVGIQ